MNIYIYTYIGFQPGMIPHRALLFRDRFKRRIKMHEDPQSCGRESVKMKPSVSVNFLEIPNNQVSRSTKQKDLPPSLQGFVFHPRPSLVGWSKV